MLVTTLAAVVFFVRFYVLENRIRRTDGRNSTATGPRR